MKKDGTGKMEGSLLKEGEDVLSEQEDKLLKELQRQPKTLKEISQMFNIAKEDVFPLVDKLRVRGYEVEVAAELDGERQVFLRKEPIPGEVVRLAPITKNEVKVLVISDTCLGLRTQQDDLLATAYKIGEQEEVYFALVAGNISAGKPSPKRSGEYFLRTFGEQVDYIVSHWPKAPFKTYFINGPTDLTFLTTKGQNLGYAISQARSDLRYRGDKEATFLVGKDIRIALVHLEGDGTVYTKSYPLQGVTENYQEWIDRVLDNNYTPKFVLVGGTHSHVLIPQRFPFSGKKKRDICSINIPSLCAITSTQRGKRKRGGSPVIGCWILTFKFDKDGNLINVDYDCRDLTAYQRRDSYLEMPVIKESLSEEKVKVLELLIEEPRRNRGEICRILHKSTPYIEEIVDGLKKEGYPIIFDEVEKRFKLEKTLKKEFKPIPLEKLYVKRAKVLHFSDSHIGSKKSRWDLLPEAYRVGEEEKVDEAHFDGDLDDGPGIKHKQLIKGEQDLIGADAQRDFTLSIWPKSKIPTKIISGSSHDFEYLELCGHNITETFAKMATLQKKGKIEYVGEDEIWCRGIVEINGIDYMLYHPTGGIPLGLTYRGQLIIERLVPIVDEDFPVKIVEIGHLHIASFMLYKGMVTLFVPCLEDETQYFAAKGLVPWIGFWVTEVFADDHDNITRVVLKYYPFEPRKRNNKRKTKVFLFSFGCAMVD